MDHEGPISTCACTGLLLLDASGGRCCFYSPCTSEETEAQAEDFVHMVRQLRQIGRNGSQGSATPVAGGHQA